jgi:hypothetical protein
MLVEKPRVTRQTIYLYSFSVHMLNKTKVTAATAALILPEKHNRSEVVAVLGPNEALPYYIHILPENSGKAVPDGGMYPPK